MVFLIPTPFICRSSGHFQPENDNICLLKTLILDCVSRDLLQEC